MPIITINRGSYNRGKEVAEKLADKLGYDCLSREILLDASDAFHIPEIKLIRALHDAPSVLERFTNGKVRYIRYLYSALLQHARKNNIVYHGLAGQFFLSGIPHVFKVRIIADIDNRVKDEMRRERISAENARSILQKDDEERRKWGLQIYGSDPWDSSLYDAVLNIGNLKVDDAVEMIMAAVQRPAFQTTPDSQQMVENLALAANVKATLALEEPNINVVADAGTLFVFNTNAPPNSAQRRQLKARLMTVEGVEAVTFKSAPKRVHRNNVNPFHNI